MIKTLAVLAGTALLAIAPANATLYQFDYSGTGADGAFTAALQLDMPVDGGTAASITGTRNGIAVTGLSDYAGGDNLFSSGFSYVDFYGLSYATAGGDDYNVYWDGSQLFEINSVTNPDGDALTDSPLTSASVTLASAGGSAPSNGGNPGSGGNTTSPAPEAATWMTMLLGFGLLGGMLRRRSSPSALAF
ncbi:PEP-CTERM sorting domain-containing protein [Sphingomonas nostoxanthinifaciens]|uniref:PEP-CTERM sorting domain-containing protein n=1 Tax=Sphingomonas nostoxanthinifaciens TaxID=2872652 RepID=UPI001CC1EA87|nr:PEP-CTERM sorting domain-containing protein [Sphingomonas nostoxanthinifaciens]UAK23405.1 hypothetical protein K8P63_13500 [Sphingomonas nostoxanthinifaciens]